MAIGSDVWPGLSKLSEECGELIQVIGKIAAYPDSPHPDGSDLRQRLMEEMADVAAAIEFVQITNWEAFNPTAFTDRRRLKLGRFLRWHKDEQGRAAS